MAARTLTRRATRTSILAVMLAGSALGAGCDEKAGAAVEPVKVHGAWFQLERATDEATRTKGLGGRDYIAPDGGMIFAFPAPLQLEFVMRDCPVAIDIAFLDGAGRVLTMYEMTPEPTRGEGEGRPGDLNMAYEARLKKYASRFPAQFAIETAGGALKKAGLQEGERVEFDVSRLKKLAR